MRRLWSGGVGSKEVIKTNHVKILGETSFMSPWHEENPFAVNLSYYSRLTDGWEDVFVLPRLASV